MTRSYAYFCEVCGTAKQAHTFRMLKDQYPELSEHNVCSKKCLRKWALKNQLLPRRFCNECVKPFIPTEENTCFCSKKCKSNYHNINILRKKQRKLEKTLII